MLPKRVTILSHEVAIRHGVPLDGADGHFFQVLMEIVISDGLSDSIERQTLDHEIRHVCWRLGGLPSDVALKDYEEEDIVTRMSAIHWDTMTRKENKAVRKFIFGED